MRVYVAILVGLLFLGCSTKQNLQNSLENELKNINLNSKEAKELSFKAQEFANELNELFDISTPPLFHNFLVNIGYKDSGLCYEFAYSMYHKISALNHKSYDLIVIKANEGEYFEHTAVAICPKNEILEECIVLDAWRDSKNIYYAKIKNDKYIWKKKN